MFNKLTKVTVLSTLAIVASQASFAADTVPTAHQSIQPITETILLSEKFGKNTSLFNFNSSSKAQAVSVERLAPEAISDDFILIDDDFVSGVVISSGEGASHQIDLNVENIAEDEFFIGTIGSSGVLLKQSAVDQRPFVPTAYRSTQPLTDPVTLSEHFGPVEVEKSVELANR